MLSSMIKQTRHALIYSDLALLLLDARKICGSGRVDDEMELIQWLAERMPPVAINQPREEIDRLRERTSKRDNYLYTVSK